MRLSAVLYSVLDISVCNRAAEFLSYVAASLQLSNPVLLRFYIF